MSEVGTNRQKRSKTGGRQKGTPNKITQVARDVIAGAAEDLGGRQRLVAWIKENPLNERAFWSQVYPKLLPLQVNGAGGGPILVAAVEWRVVDHPES